MLAKAIFLGGVALALAGCGAQRSTAARHAAPASGPSDCAGTAIEQALCFQKKELEAQRAEIDRQGEALERIEQSLTKLESAAGAGSVVVLSTRRRETFGSCHGPIDSKSCKRVARDACRERGFNNGRVVNTGDDGLIAVRQIACIRPSF